MVTFMAYNITDQIKCLEHKIVSYKLSQLMYHLELVLLVVWCSTQIWLEFWPKQGPSGMSDLFDIFSAGHYLPSGHTYSSEGSPMSSEVKCWHESPYWPFRLSLS